MKRHWSVLALLLLVVSCKHRDVIPSNVLPQQTMQSVLWDIMRADQFLNDFGFRDTTLKKDSMREAWYRQVFLLHATNRDEFKRSFDFYNRHPNLLRVMMDSISALADRENLRPADTTKKHPLSADSSGRINVQ